MHRAVFGTCPRISNPDLRTYELLTDPQSWTALLTLGIVPGEAAPVRLHTPVHGETGGVATGALRPRRLSAGETAMSRIAAEVLFIVGLVVLNGVFAMSEIAVVSSRRARLQQRADAGDAGARRALAVAEEPTASSPPSRSGSR